MSLMGSFHMSVYHTQSVPLGAGDRNRTRVLSLGSDPEQFRAVVYGPESLRLLDSSEPG
jgi:hypothetical protein